MKYPHAHIKNLVFSFKKYPVLYFRVPKVASTSLLITFRKVDEVEKVEEYQKYPTYNSYFKFAFVRNPFDRLASCFRHVIQKGSLQNIQEDPRLHKNMSFESFVDVVGSIKVENMDIHFRPQHTFIPETLDYIGKFECLNDDYAKLLQKTGIKEPKDGLLHKNKTDKTDFKKYYNEMIIQKVITIYKKDFELFEYKKTL